MQSTDKNFLVPVGGAVVASHSVELIKAVAQIYPGMYLHELEWDMLYAVSCRTSLIQSNYGCVYNLVVSGLAWLPTPDRREEGM